MRPRSRGRPNYTSSRRSAPEYGRWVFAGRAPAAAMRRARAEQHRRAVRDGKRWTTVLATAGVRSPPAPGQTHRPPPAGAGSVVNRCGGGWSAMADAPSTPAPVRTRAGVNRTRPIERRFPNSPDLPGDRRRATDPCSTSAQCAEDHSQPDTTSVPHFQDHASDNWEPEGAGSDGVVNRSWSGRRSNMLSWSTCSIW